MQNRFDLFKTVIAYIQSRGRARRKDSKYIIMINQQNPKDVQLLKNVSIIENQMKDYCRMLPKDRNLALMFDESTDLKTYEPEYIKETLSKKYLEGAFCIESTGALLTRSNAIALIYYYCATLPSDNFCSSKPIFEFEDLTNDNLSFEEKKALDLPPIDMTTYNKKIFCCTLTLPINARVQQFKTYDRSKEDVKARVSLQACIALYKAGDIDDHLIPKSKTQRKALMEIEEEVDENGKQIGSRGRENFYDKKQPSFWAGEIDGYDDNNMRLGPYWLSLIVVDSHVQQQAAPLFRPMCLITKKPLPKIPEITLFNDNIPFKIHIKSQPEALLFNRQEQIDNLGDYTFCFMKCITNKDFSCSRNNIEYFVAPLAVSSSHSSDSSSANSSSLPTQGKIDWAEITKTVTNSNLSVDTKCNDILDSIVIDISDPKRKKYFVQNVQHDMTPMSKIPASITTRQGTRKKFREHGYETFAEYYENQEFLSTKITDMTQPLLRVNRVYNNQSFLYMGNNKQLKKKDKEPESIVVWLVPEICQLYPISASVYQTLLMIPDVMARIDAVLLLHDAKQSLGLSNKMNDTLMLEAFTASSAGLEKDYQRLEFLGGKLKLR